jgi:cell cycle checkpoint protein
MDSSLHEVWQAAAGSPFLPTIGKESQFTVGFLLLLIGVALTGYFALSRFLIRIAPSLSFDIEAK